MNINITSIQSIRILIINDNWCDIKDYAQIQNVHKYSHWNKDDDWKEIKTVYNHAQKYYDKYDMIKEEWWNKVPD